MGRMGWVELPPACRWQAAAFSQEELQLTGAWPHSVLLYQPRPEWGRVRRGGRDRHRSSCANSSLFAWL